VTDDFTKHIVNYGLVASYNDGIRHAAAATRFFTDQQEILKLLKPLPQWDWGDATADPERLSKDERLSKGAPSTPPGPAPTGTAAAAPPADREGER